MKSVRALVFLCLIALFIGIIPAFAQDNPVGLSDDDWELFQTGAANLSVPTAYTMTLDVSLTAGGQDVAVNLEGEGLITDSGFSNSVEGTLSAEGESNPAMSQVIVIGDTLYISLDGQQWFSSTTDELMSMVSQFGAMGMGGALPVDPEALAGGDMSSIMMMPGMMEAITALNDIDLTNFISITREADMDGAAHFVTTLTFADLFDDPALAGFIMAMSGASSGMGSTEMSPEMMAQMGPMMAQMFGDSALVIEHYIDEESGALLGATITLDMNIGMGSQAISADIVFNISFSDADGAELEAPANAQPLSQMMGMMSGMGS